MNCTQVSEVLPPYAVGRLACLTPPKRKDNPFARMLEHAKPEEPATAVTEENESRRQASGYDAKEAHIFRLKPQTPVPKHHNTKGTVPIVRLKAREKNRLKFCRIEEKSVSLHRK